MAELVADVPVFLLGRPASAAPAALPDQALVRRLAGVFAATPLGHHHLQARAVQRLQGLRFRVKLRKVAARRGRQTAHEWSHHAAIVLAGVHGYLRESAAALGEGGLGSSMAQLLLLSCGLERGPRGKSDCLFEERD